VYNCEHLTEEPELKTLELQLHESKATRSNSTSAVEALIGGQANENIPRTLHSSEKGPCPTKKSHGSELEAPSSPRCIFPTF
jgi:hypothetical protein